MALVLGGDLPNCLASLFSEFHVSLGFTSKILPKSGTPGGPGIGVGIALETRGYYYNTTTEGKKLERCLHGAGGGERSSKCQMPNANPQLAARQIQTCGAPAGLHHSPEVRGELKRSARQRCNSAGWRVPIAPEAVMHQAI